MSLRDLVPRARTGLLRRFYASRARGIEERLRELQGSITNYEPLGESGQRVVDELEDSYWRRLKEYGPIGDPAVFDELAGWVRSFEQRKIEAGGVWVRVERGLGVPVYVKKLECEEHG